MSGVGCGREGGGCVGGGLHGGKGGGGDDAGGGGDAGGGSGDGDDGPGVAAWHSPGVESDWQAARALQWLPYVTPSLPHCGMYCSVQMAAGLDTHTASVCGGGGGGVDSVGEGSGGDGGGREGGNNEGAPGGGGADGEGGSGGAEGGAQRSLSCGLHLPSTMAQRRKVPGSDSTNRVSQSAGSSWYLQHVPWAIRVAVAMNAKAPQGTCGGGDGGGREGAGGGDEGGGGAGGSEGGGDGDGGEGGAKGAGGGCDGAGSNGGGEGCGGEGEGEEGGGGAGSGGEGMGGDGGGAEGGGAGDGGGGAGGGAGGDQRGGEGGGGVGGGSSSGSSGATTLPEASTHCVGSASLQQTSYATCVQSPTSARPAQGGGLAFGADAPQNAALAVEAAQSTSIQVLACQSKRGMSTPSRLKLGIGCCTSDHCGVPTLSGPCCTTRTYRRPSSGS